MSTTIRPGLRASAEAYSRRDPMSTTIRGEVGVGVVAEVVDLGERDWPAAQAGRESLASGRGEESPSGAAFSQSRLIISKILKHWEPAQAPYFLSLPAWASIRGMAFTDGNRPSRPRRKRAR